MGDVRDNVLQFEEDLQAFAKQVDVQIGLVVRKVLFDLFRKIVLRTPVDTGRAAGSWIVSRDSPAPGALPPGQYGRPDAEGLAVEAMAGLVIDPPEAIYWIANNLPYIESLEFGLYPIPSRTGKTIEGFSIQAPAGMVRISLAEVETEMWAAREQAANG